MNIDVELDKVVDILGDRVKTLEVENALLKAALNQATAEIERAQIQRMEDMAIPLPGLRATGDEKQGFFPESGLFKTTADGVVPMEAPDCVDPR